MHNLIEVKNDSNLIYDVGLHKGEDALFYLMKGFRVVGFEADPELIDFCKKRLALYIENGQLTIVEGAIVDMSAFTGEIQTVKFFKNENNSVWGTVMTEWAERNQRMGAKSKIIEVPVVDFEKILQKFGMPYYMKIDIEGCDSVCLGMLKNFKSKPSYISIESEKTSFEAIRRETRQLVDLGYNFFQAVEQGTLPARQKPPKPAREGAYVDFHFEEGATGLFGKELEGEWKSFDDLMSQYRLIRLGYFLVGDDGVITKWSFPGAWRIRGFVSKILKRFTKENVPGWYDTHAKHRSVE